MTIEVTRLFVANVVSLVLMFMFLGAKIGTKTKELESLYNALYYVCLIVAMVCIMLRK